jgi:endonuclease/exonuclease/phosphatase family metal-dependent hydrolase
MKLRVTTFNCENLFGRYRFLELPPGQQPTNYAQAIQIFDVIAFGGNKIKPRAISEAQRKNTGAVVLAVQPDILAVCEVENLTTLRLFNAIYMNNHFDRVILMDGNDPRGIDVGLLLRKGLKAEVGAIRSHADEAAAGGFLSTTNMLDMQGRVGSASFSRDCLEVEVNVAGKALSFLVNHLKAQETKPNGSDPTTAKRRGQAERAALIARRCRSQGRTPIVLGDLNKDIQSAQYDNSINPLAKSSVFTNPLMQLAPAERWTHFFESQRSVSQLDYILPDKSLASALDGVEIFRGGLSPKCKQFTGPRVGTVAVDGLEASDHCAVSVDLDL